MDLASGEIHETRCALVWADCESLHLQIFSLYFHFDQTPVSYAFNPDVWAPGMFSSTDQTQPTDKALPISQY